MTKNPRSFSYPSPSPDPHAPSSPRTVLLSIRRPRLGRLLGKLHSQNQVLETEAVHLVAGLDRILAVREADEREALRQTRVFVLGQEHAGDPAEPLEHIAQLAFFGHLRDLEKHGMSVSKFSAGGEEPKQRQARKPKDIRS